MNDRAPTSLRQRTARNPWLRTALEWTLPFLGFVAAIWLATQSRNAPQLILVALLTVIAVNFSVPFGRAAISPVLPVVAVLALLVVGPAPALAALAAGFLLAEFSRPLWQPLWRDSPMDRLGWRPRALRAGAHLLALLAPALLNAGLGAPAPLPFGQIAPTQQTLLLLTQLAAVYSMAYFLIISPVTWMGHSRDKGSDALLLLMVAVFSQPFALFGAITYQALGLPAFVLFCVGAGAFAIMSWLSWQRHFELNQRIAQFSTLNSVAASLRETLELPTVLQRIHEQVAGLIPADDFALTLRQEDGSYRRVLTVRRGRRLDEESSPDDLTQWVLQRGQTLALDEENMHFAARHGLPLPRPQPRAWLGVPLTTGDGVTGAIVLQRFEPAQPFGAWNRELLTAIAGQVSAVLKNAQLYEEMRRLYKLTDEALAQRLRQLQALLDSTSEGVLMLDTAGDVVLVNPTAARLLNRRQEALQDRHIEPARFAPDLGYDDGELDELLCALQQGRQPESRRTVYKTHVRDSSTGPESRRFIERYETPVVVADGQLLGWLIVLRDVTEEQERIEWRTNATRMIVHDLRNPVTTLTSNIDIIEAALSTGEHERVRRHAQQARYGAEEMLDMIDSLMDMTRLEAGQLVLEAEAMRVPPLVQTVVERLRPLATQKQIDLSVQAPPDLPAVWADEELLRRIFVNLLDNALKFTPAGGAVSLALAEEPALEAHDAGVRCTVSDTGPGIAMTHKERIFERFTRVNVGGGQVRGTGLGLAFCRLAIEEHGGAIWVEDAPGGGSRFVFTLPGIPHFDED